MGIGEIKRIDIFPHSGKLIPEEVVPLIKQGVSKSQVGEIIEANRDRGLEQVIQEYRNNPLPGQKLVVFDYTEVLCNTNRLDIEKQVPRQLYRGETFWEYDLEIAKVLVNKYIKPWYENIISLIKDNPEAIAIHWHSFDKYGSGNHDINKGKGDKRPLGQFITRCDHLGASLRNFFPEYKENILQTEYVDSDLYEGFINIFNDALLGFSKEGTQGFSLDTPYKPYGLVAGKQVDGSSLPGLISVVNGNKKNSQLLLEIRKDVISKPETVLPTINAVNQIVEKIISKKF